MTTDLGPQPVGGFQTFDVEQLTGCFIPVTIARTPVLCSMDGTDDLFIPVFTSPALLQDRMAELDIDYDRIMHIDDGREFFASIDEMNRTGGRPFRLRICRNPYRHENGRVRFFEVLEASN